MSSGLAKAILQGTVKGTEEEVHRRGGQTILKSGQEWTLSAQQMKAGQGGKGLLKVICDASCSGCTCSPVNSLL